MGLIPFGHNPGAEAVAELTFLRDQNRALIRLVGELKGRGPTPPQAARSAKPLRSFAARTIGARLSPFWWRPNGGERVRSVANT